MSRLALASILLVALASTGAIAQPVSVTCEVYELWASHDKGGMDPGIPKQLGNRLNNDLKFTQYKLLSSKKDVKLDKKKAEAVKLAKGSAKLELVEIVDKNQIRLNVDFAAATKGAKANPTLAAADWIAVVAKQSSAATADAHVLGLSCK
jgi:hypothetical protein